MQRAHRDDRAVAVLDRLYAVCDNNCELVADIVGAPNSSVIREIVARASPPVTAAEAPGVSGIRDASSLKHELNEMLIDSAGYAGKLIALELGQGAGDCTLRYQKHGWVVAVENDPEHLAAAAGRVAHIAIPARTRLEPDTSPLNLSPTELSERFDDMSPRPALMFSGPTSASEAVKRLSNSQWRFNWIDIDPLGFAEASNIEVLSCYSVTTREAVLCITNGGLHGARFGTARTMVDFLTKGCLVPDEGKRKLQRDALDAHILAVESARRVEDALTMGLCLHPILLYDGRSGHSEGVKLMFQTSPLGL